MSRLRVARALILTAVATCSLAAVASAEAAAWQGPMQISGAGLNLGDTTARISLGANGDAGAGWWDDFAGGRFVLARKPLTGGAFAAPVTLAASAMATPVYVGMDGGGNLTAAYTTAGPTWNVATWAASAVAPTATPLTIQNPLQITDLAVNAEGDAVLAGLSGTGGANSVVVGYRHLSTGTFEFHTYSNVDIGFAATAARVAINGTGTAVVVFRGGPKLLAAVRTAIFDWPPAFESVRDDAVQDTVPSVAIDGTGAIVTAYTYKIGTMPTILRTSSRPPAGGWQPSPDLSSTATGAVAANPTVATNAAGASVVAWDETGPAPLAAIQARAATTTAGNWGAIETVDAASDDAPAAAIGNDGTAVAAWENQGLSGNTGQASVRSPGASGSWSDIHDVTSSHPNASSVSLSTDGLGDFATISAPFSSTLMVKPATVSVYDAAPPTLAPPTFAGGSFAGLPITMTTTAYDSWSTITGPLWTFGDGFTATGLTVTHAYSFGDYLANVSVTDAAGNSARRDFIANAAQAEATIQRGAFRATWKRSRVSGTLTLTGTVPDAGTYAVVVSRLGTPGRRRVLASVALGLGQFTRSIRLPATLLPGSYVASLDGDSPFVDGPGFLVKLAAPAEGVVDVAALSRTRAGKGAKTLSGASTVWARFHFAAIPKGKKLTVTWYRTVKGKRVKLRTASKKPVATVRDSLGVRGRRGTITVVLTRAGKVIFQSSVRLK